jgi:hypothetical protein
MYEYTIDQSLLNNGYKFDINWQIIEVATGIITNNWCGAIFNNGDSNSVDQWFTGAPEITRGQ